MKSLSQLSVSTLLFAVLSPCGYAIEGAPVGGKTQAGSPTAAVQDFQGPNYERPRYAFVIVAPGESKRVKYFIEPGWRCVDQGEVKELVSCPGSSYHVETIESGAVYAAEGNDMLHQEGASGNGLEGPEGSFMEASLNLKFKKSNARNEKDKKHASDKVETNVGVLVLYAKVAPFTNAKQKTKKTNMWPSPKRDEADAPFAPPPSLKIRLEGVVLKRIVPVSPESTSANAELAQKLSIKEAELEKARDVELALRREVTSLKASSLASDKALSSVTSERDGLSTKVTSLENEVLQLHQEKESLYPAHAAVLTAKESSLEELRAA